MNSLEQISDSIAYARAQLEQCTPDNYEFRMALANANLAMAQTMALMELTTAVREEGARTRAYRMEVSGKLQLISEAIERLNLQ